MKELLEQSARLVIRILFTVVPFILLAAFIRLLF
jgi:hypothetical protein